MVGGPRRGLLSCGGREVQIVCAGRGRGSARLRLRNEGDQPLALSASWNEEWVNVEKMRDLDPGAEEEMLISVRPDHTWEGVRTVRLTLVSNGTPVEILVRVNQVRRFRFVSFLLGLLIGLVPFVAELLLVFVGFDVLLRRRETGEGHDNVSFLFGLAPGVLWHLFLLLR